MPEGKKLLQLGFIGLSTIAIFGALVLSCVLHDKDPFLSTLVGILVLGIWSYVMDVWN